MSFETMIFLHPFMFHNKKHKQFYQNEVIQVLFFFCSSMNDSWV